jgi:hypothetical protein
MLTIEKEPTLLQKYGVFAAAFAIGLVGSLGALHAVDPKRSVTVGQVSESSRKEDTVGEPAKPTPDPVQHADTSDAPATLVQSQPVYQADNRSTSTPGKTETKPQSMSSNAEEDPTREEPAASGDSLFNLPIIELLFFTNEDQDK